MILILESEQFKQEKKEDDSDQFPVLNEICRAMNEAAEEGKGIVAQFTDAGAVLLFENGVEDALKTAEKACKDWEAGSSLEPAWSMAA